MPVERALRPATDSRRFYELDSLRGVAALTVVFHHFSRICGPRVTWILFHTPLRLFIAGHQAVILFFLLSGFVLTLPYKKRDQLNYPPFLVKRVCRIYLPYLCALALAVLCDLHLPGQRHYENYWLNQTWGEPVTTRLVLQHVLFLGNYDWTQFNTAFWSLVYEMRISLIFPFLALAVLRLRAAWLVTAAIALSLSYLPLALLFSNVFHLASRVAAINTTLTLHYAAFFIIGSLMAKNLHTIGRWYDRFNSVQISILAFAALALYGFADSSSIVKRLPIPVDLYDWPVAAGAILLIIFAMHSQPFHRFLTSRGIHHLGKISYSLYLIHGTVLFALIHTLLGRVSTGVLLILYLSITLLVTEIFYRLIERPTMLLGRRLTSPHTLPETAKASG